MTIMLKSTLLTVTVGLITAFITYSAFAANDNLAQKYQSMINKAYNNALGSLKPVTPPNDSKAAISSGQNALTPTAPTIPAVAAAPAPSQASTAPNPQPPVSAPPPASITNPNATAPAGPPNIFITPGGTSGGSNNSQNRGAGSNNIIHY